MSGQTTVLGSSQRLASHPPGHQTSGAPICVLNVYLILICPCPQLMLVLTMLIHLILLPSWLWCTIPIIMTARWLWIILTSDHPPTHPHLIHLILTMLIHLILILICPGDPKWRVWSSSSQHPPPWPLTQSPNTGILTHQQGHHQEYLHCIIFFPAVLLSKVEDPVKGSVYRNYRLHLPTHWPRVC